MKRPPQIAEELEEEEVDKLRYWFSNFQILPQTMSFFVVTDFFLGYFLFTGDEEEAGPDSSEDEEASSSEGIGGGGSGQAAVSGGTGFQIFKFYHRLCHCFVVTDFFVVTFCLQERRRRQDQTLQKMKRPQVAEELEEEEVDKLLL